MPWQCFRCWYDHENRSKQVPLSWSLNAKTSHQVGTTRSSFERYRIRYNLMMRKLKRNVYHGGLIMKSLERYRIRYNRMMSKLKSNVYHGSHNMNSFERYNTGGSPYLRFWFSQFWLFTDAKTTNNEAKLLILPKLSLKYQFWYLQFEIFQERNPCE